MPAVGADAVALIMRQDQRLAPDGTGGVTRPKDILDLALLMVGRDLLARASKLVTITVESVAWDDLIGMYGSAQDGLSTLCRG